MDQESSVCLSHHDLIQDLIQGCKPSSEFKIGVEHEKFIFQKNTLARVSYENGILPILQGLQAWGWEALYEGDFLIALVRGRASISLEPGGQLELSGAPLPSLHDTAQELRTHFRELVPLLDSLGFMAVGLGYDPVSQRDQVPWMPKQRYQIMKNYMPSKGIHGLDMMTRTCTVQVNLDLSSEQDMIRKFRVALALQPLATALFSCSPFSEGKPNGFLSFRRFIWEHTDPDRCGLLDFVFSPSMGFESYVAYMLDVPMYFVRREGQYMSAAGQSFRDFLKGSLRAYLGQCPTLEDWHDHLTVAFPEVRLKKGFLEMRGADGGSEVHLNALPAFWVGLFYDETALKQVSQLIGDWDVQDLRDAYAAVARQGLNVCIQGQRLREWGKMVLRLARDGLHRRGLINQQGYDESIYLTYLDKILETGQTAAHTLLDRYQKKEGRISDILEPYK